MISVDHIVAMVIREPVVLDQLGEALQNDLVLGNPYYRNLVEFADSFMLQRHKVPGMGDWELWLEGLDAGMIQDGTREALGRLLAIDLSEFDPGFFAEQALPHLQQSAVQVAKARLNEAGDLPPEAFVKLAEQVEKVQAGGVQGLARLEDVDVWAKPQREDALTPTGYPRLDQMIGGWGKELWVVFADSGVGKTTILQNWMANAARVGKRGLHLTLELGVQPQIQRYYRQLAQAQRAEFAKDLGGVKKKLRHWLRLAQGEVLLLEQPAYGLDPDGLKRIIDRLNRTVGEFDILALDYLDLMTLPRQTRSGRRYEDLGRITHEVRSLCETFDLTVLTASQAVRRPEHKDRLTLRDMGDSYEKVRGADGIIGLWQKEEEEEVYQGRINLLKVRDSGGRGSEINLYINRELSLIQELNHPNTVELMRRLGHLPSQLQTP